MDVLGVFVVDPGKISGVGAGVFPMVGGTVADVYREAMKMKMVETWETEGEWQDQAEEIIESFHEWREGVLDVVDEIHVVSEDFQLTRRTATGEVQMLSGSWVLWPVKISAAVEVALRPHPVEYQQPSQVKTYATDKRLRDWGLWIPSSRDHRRDATRHLLLKIHKHLK